MTSPTRTARVARRTGESDVVVEVDLDGSGRSTVSTGVPFYDHMLASFAKHSLLDLDVQAKGDVEVDAHHTVEAIKGQRDRIVASLAALGARPVPSDANFVLFGGLSDASAAWRALLDRGVLVRDVGLPGHLRVTAGTEPETTAFLDAAAEVLPPLLEDTP